MPAINSALIISKLNKLEYLIKLKRKLHHGYVKNFEKLKKIINKLDPYLKEFQNLNKY